MLDTERTSVAQCDYHLLGKPERFTFRVRASLSKYSKKSANTAIRCCRNFSQVLCRPGGVRNQTNKQRFVEDLHRAGLERVEEPERARRRINTPLEIDTMIKATAHGVKEIGISRQKRCCPEQNKIYEASNRASSKKSGLF